MGELATVIACGDGDADTALIREIGAELLDMVQEHKRSIENLEPVGVRLGLSDDAILFAMTENRRRLRLLTFAHQHFELMAAALQPLPIPASPPRIASG